MTRWTPITLLLLTLTWFLFHIVTSSSHLNVHLPAKFEIYTQNIVDNQVIEHLQKILWNYKINAPIFTLGILVGIVGTIYVVRWLTVEQKFRKFQHWDVDWDFPTVLKDNYISSLYPNHLRPTRTLILVHQGQSDPNDLGLSAEGLKQAKLLGQRLNVDNDFSGIYFSPLSAPAKQTAEIVKEMAQGVLKEEELLTERIPCVPQPMTVNFKPNGATLQELVEQEQKMEEAFLKFFHRAQPFQRFESHEILICGVNVIRFFVCRALQLPPEAWLRFNCESLDFTSVTILKVYSNGHVQLVRYGDNSHLSLSN